MRVNAATEDRRVATQVWRHRGAMARKCCVVALLGSTTCLEAAASREPVDMSIEELSGLTVTSVSRNAEPLSGAAASIFVITSEDIRRSGATSLPEILRLAPNLEVARIDTGAYAITARGFNTVISNKLLVLIDGRTVYSELFGGVFWEAQDVILGDIERIEVISGPAAATWGVNAVNGVINVITRKAADSQGTLATVGAGNREAGVSLRQGFKLGDDGHMRLYGKVWGQEETTRENGIEAGDQWDRGQVGFRADWGRPASAFTLQGDAYDAASEERPGFAAVDVSGANLLARWSQARDDDSSLEVQAYYDKADRKDEFLLNEEAEIFDLQARHTLPVGIHRVTWGGGYRKVRDKSDPGQFFAFVPSEQEFDLYNIFGQAEIRVTQDLNVTLGLRYEHNDYTGWETLPSIRAAYQLTPSQLLWAAVSRPVRSPARVDREIVSPPQPPYFLAGGPNFEAETATVYELGYRAQPSASLSYSITAFQHQYDNLASAQILPGQIFIENGFEGDVTGLEGWGNLQVLPSWRLGWGGMVLHKDLHLKPGANDPTGGSNLGNDPDYQLMLRSSHNLTEKHELDFIIRHVEELPQPEVPAYTALDARIGWHVTPAMEVSLAVRNLLDERHPEFGNALIRSEIERSAFLKVVVRQ